MGIGVRAAMCKSRISKVYVQGPINSVQGVQNASFSTKEARLRSESSFAFIHFFLLYPDGFPFGARQRQPSASPVYYQLLHGEGSAVKEHYPENTVVQTLASVFSLFCPPSVRVYI